MFDNDVMKLEFARGFALEFRAKEALRVWAHKHLCSDVAVLEVPYAKEWKEKSMFASGKPLPQADEGGEVAFLTGYCRLLSTRTDSRLVQNKKKFRQSSA